MIQTLPTMPESVLARELSLEIEALVQDFRARKPGVQDWEIDAGVALARHRLRQGGRARVVLVVIALSAAALVAALAVAWSGA